MRETERPVSQMTVCVCGVTGGSWCRAYGEAQAQVSASSIPLPHEPVRITYGEQSFCGTFHREDGADPAYWCDISDGQGQLAARLLWTGTEHLLEGPGFAVRIRAEQNRYCGFVGAEPVFCADRCAVDACPEEYALEKAYSLRFYRWLPWEAVMCAAAFPMLRIR